MAIERLKKIQKALFDELWITAENSPDFDAIHDAWVAISNGIRKLEEDSNA